MKDFNGRTYRTLPWLKRGNESSVHHGNALGEFREKFLEWNKEYEDIEEEIRIDLTVHNFEDYELVERDRLVKKAGLNPNYNAIGQHKIRGGKL